MTNERPPRACLWLRVSTDTKGQDTELQRADLERVCEQRGWEIVQVYEVEDKVDADLVMRLRSEGRSWREIAEAHLPVKSASGGKVKPSVGSIRRAWHTKRNEGFLTICHSGQEP